MFTGTCNRLAGRKGLSWWLNGKESTCNAGEVGLGQGDPLEKEMATHSSIFAWEIMDSGAWWATVHRVAKELRQDSLTEQQQQSKQIH